MNGRAVVALGPFVLAAVIPAAVAAQETQSPRAALATVAVQEAQSTRAADACLRLDNRILGPRTSNRPLPLLKGDAAHGFHPACTVAWRTLSPRNEALPVTDCFRGNLLQLPNASACGSGTGSLWVSSRWVMTSADLEKPATHAAACQQLDTGAWAGTRGFDFDCVPHKKALRSAPAAAAANASMPAGAGGRGQSGAEPGAAPTKTPSARPASAPPATAPPSAVVPGAASPAESGPQR